MTMNHISRIRLQNIRGFQNLEIDLLRKERQPNRLILVIGRNGTCKTTLLRSIVIGLCGETEAHALLSEPLGELMTKGEQKAEIEMDLLPGPSDDPITLTTKIEKDRDKTVIIRENSGEGRLSDPPFLCGYGTGRSATGSETGRPYRIAESAHTLFNYNETLTDPELTLRRLRDYLVADAYEKVIQNVRRLLALSDEDGIRLRRGGGIELSGPSVGRQIPLQAWADGPRIFLHWLLDLYGWAMRAERLTSSGGMRGIVLIDEIEQHLHPSLQAGMPHRLNRVFPEIQFIATTQSPLTILGTRPENVVSLHRRDNMIFAGKTPDFSGYSAEDMLVDHRLFDTCAYPPETDEKLERHHRLSGISKDERTQGQTEELRTLARELMAQQIPEVRESVAARELRKLLQRHGL